MRNKALLPLLGALVLLVLISGFFLLSQNSGTSSSQSLPTILDVSVQNNSFVVKGRNLNQVEVWAVPSGTDIGQEAYQKIGDATPSQATTSTDQTWTLAVPSSPMLITQLFARGYGENGISTGDVFFPYTGATEIYQALWGSSEDGGDTQICQGCIGINNNGETFTVSLASRITLELPLNSYNPQDLAISPSGSLGETFGATPPPSYWARTFETVDTGTVTIHIPGKIADVPDFKITIEVASSS